MKFLFYYFFGEEGKEKYFVAKRYGLWYIGVWLFLVIGMIAAEILGWVIFESLFVGWILSMVYAMVWAVILGNFGGVKELADCVYDIPNKVKKLKPWLKEKRLKATERYQNAKRLMEEEQ